MKKERIKQLLPSLNSKATGFRNGWVQAHCPVVWNHGGKDAHPSFGVKETTNRKSICHCWSCGAGGDLLDLVYDIRKHLKQEFVDGYDLPTALQLIAAELDELDIDPSSIPDYDAAPEKKELVFPDSWLASFKSATHFTDAMKYLHSRGIPNAWVEKHDIRYDPQQKRVCFPYRNFKGELMGVQGRSLDPDSNLRYYQYGYLGHRNGHVWMGEDSVNLDMPVVLCEGPFDRASIMRVYPNVVASFTSGVSKEKLMRVSDAVDIVTLYDYGNGGDAARGFVDKYLKKVPRHHCIPSEEEDDAGSMGVPQLVAHLQDHVKLA